VVECLPSKHKALSSNSSIAKKIKNIYNHNANKMREMHKKQDLWWFKGRQIVSVLKQVKFFEQIIEGWLGFQQPARGENTVNITSKLTKAKIVKYILAVVSR
jgi:hypothetical protein